MLTDPIPAANTPPPRKPPPDLSRSLASAILHVVGTALSGVALMRGMWIDDWVLVGFMLPATGINIYTLWDAFRDRQ